MLQNPSKQQRNSIQQTENSWVSHRARPYTQRFYYFCGSEPSFFAGYWRGSCKQALGGSLLHARAFWKRNLKEQSLMHWITLLVHLLLIFVPTNRVNQRILQTTLSKCTGLSRPLLKGRRPCVCTESPLRSHTRFFRQLPGILFSLPCRKKCWRSHGCSVVCHHLCLFFQAALWYITYLFWRAWSSHKKSIKDTLTLPRNRKQESLSAIAN